MSNIFQREFYLRRRGDLKKAVMRHSWSGGTCYSSRTNESSPLQCTSTSLKCASGLQEHHAEHLNGLATFILPHFFNCFTVIFDIDNKSQKKDITYFLNQTH